MFIYYLLSLYFVSVLRIIPFGCESFIFLKTDLLLSCVLISSVCATAVDSTKQTNAHRHKKGEALKKSFTWNLFGICLVDENNEKKRVDKAV